MADILRFPPIGGDEPPRTGVVHLPLHRMAKATRDEGMMRALEQPLDYPQRFKVVRPRHDVTDLYAGFCDSRPTVGDRIETFFRRHGNSVVIAIVSFALGGLAFAGLAFVVRLVLL